jgi:hypothetical protein
MPDVSGGPGIPKPGGYAGSLSKDVVAAIGDLTQLLNALIQSRLRRSAAYRMAVPWRAL